MTNLMLNKVIETLFTDEVYIDVKATSPSDNGTLPILKNIIATIKDGTLCLSTKYGTFFKLVRITYQNSSDYIIIPLCEPYLKKIKWHGDWKFNEIEWDFGSKQKNLLHQKYIFNFMTNPTFYNARKLFMFWVKYGYLRLSSEFGFDGEKIEVLTIRDLGWMSSMKNKEKKHHVLVDLRKKQQELECEISKLETILCKTRSRIKKMEEF